MSDREMVALVLPSLFAVSSILVVEALVLGAACLCADLDPLVEQAEDAAVYFDPRSPQSIADSIWRVWSDDGFRQTLVDHAERLVERKYTRRAFAQ